jgi:uncharacterized protein (DUF1501 family)
MGISRRNFIKISAIASASSLMPNFLKAFESHPEDEEKSMLLRKLTDINKILVIIQLSGGNDGLNTAIPYSNDNYYNYRPKLAVESAKILKLNDNVGLHPNMVKFKELYDNGNLTVINNVGYPNPDRSHFRSMDIWQSARDSNEYLNTGWIGRYLDSECPVCKNPYNAIEVDDTLSLALKGETKNGIAAQSPERFYITSAEKFFQDLSGEYTKKNLNKDSNLNYLYKTLIETTSSADYIYKTSKTYKSKTEYPQNEFGNHLKTIAEMIISGLNTSVYYVSLGGFDTHFNQQPRQDQLLKQLTEGLFSFMQDLKQNNRVNDVLVMTFSEFGRRVKENASGGTDHGTANNVFLISGGLKRAGVNNEPPNLTDLDNGDLKYQVDFRSIYATILNKWLNINDKKILNKTFSYMDFI